MINETFTAGSSGRRKFSAEFKRDAVNLVILQGYSFKRAADAVGVSSRSLCDWHEEISPKRQRGVSRGDLMLVKANPEEFELLGQRHVSDSPTWAHLAVCGTEIYVRDLKGLILFRW